MTAIREAILSGEGNPDEPHSDARAAPPPPGATRESLHPPSEEAARESKRGEESGKPRARLATGPPSCSFLAGTRGRPSKQASGIQGQPRKQVNIAQQRHPPRDRRREGINSQPFNNSETKQIPKFGGHSANKLSGSSSWIDCSHAKVHDLKMLGGDSARS